MINKDNLKVNINTELVPAAQYHQKQREEAQRAFSTTRNILIFYIYGEKVKTLNGSPPGSTSSYMLELQPIEYSYKYRNSNKTAFQRIYQIKGLRGMFRHGATKYCATVGLDVCNTTEKEVDKHGNSYQVDFLHPAGECIQEESKIS